MSEHPLAKAIVEKADGLEFSDVADFEQIVGQGVKGNVDGKKVLAGNYKMMRENILKYRKMKYSRMTEKHHCILRWIISLSE